MRKLLRRIGGWLIRRSGAPSYTELENRLDQATTQLERTSLELQGWKRRCGAAKEAYESLRAQVVQLRVGQSTIGRAGWEVMCFIPEEVIEKIANSLEEPRMLHDPQWRSLVTRIGVELVDLALRGVNRVRSNGTVAALVFGPLKLNEAARAPRFVQALWDSDGNYKLSEKCWDQRSEAQRVRGF